LAAAQAMQNRVALPIYWLSPAFFGERSGGWERRRASASGLDHEECSGASLSLAVAGCWRDVVVFDLGCLFVRGEFLSGPRVQEILLTLMWLGFAAVAWWLTTSP